ncbi:interleukin-like EMT inducer domain-containing protein [Paenibacillus xylanexedens]|uniref:interleukin-like EMT inducer domain-containing protein n=1 Tax=Paenibacillus xylanexedens TaxID=528191 RepID=UPI00119D8064|nr:interleukin-like EMT inducer domain-containing protein [Paenibacillus xylanexedens]
MFVLSLNIAATTLALLWISILSSFSLKREQGHIKIQSEEEEVEVVKSFIVQDKPEQSNSVIFSEWYKLLENDLETPIKIVYNPQWYRASEEYNKFKDFYRSKAVTLVKERNLDFQVERPVVHFDDPLLMPLLWNKGYNIKVVQGKSFADLLNEVNPFTLIFLSVKDDGSQALNHKWQEKLADYGVQKLTREYLRSSYMNVIWKKGQREYISLYEDVSDKALSKEIKSGYKINDFVMPIHLEMKSAGYNSGNISSVKIGGEEYSPNLRGMNIVLYDLMESKVKSVHRVDTFVSIFEDNTIYCAYPEEEQM